ncbi:SurA N-terminal domain-containing protein [Myroides albus]|uniref:Periplasmic chaperone PpiD n=1 Tax=Myroides albus TaxID=2562892 RepID=A0A6I3LKR6_9FLAO|nr:peptidylprolyl isomerase [Myroides albus]MTG97101.1 peptidylprolyl isomerase [Myroides albus]UVD78476.1 SurA N-terminal domain-containing protein [Myroides albus]
MAVLSKIRQRSALLIAGIGIALLAFIVGDVVRGTGAGAPPRNVGKINGHEINTREFSQRVAQLEQQQQISNSQAIETIWNEQVSTILLNEEIEKLGLRIGKEQLVNVAKSHPVFANNPEFLDEAGQFNTQKFNEFILSFKSGGPEMWNQWLAFEKDLERFGLQQMYFALIQGGLYTTDLDAKFAYKTDNSKVSFDYVTIAYSTINNEEASVSDAEILDYMKKHENRFKSEPTRVIEYAFVPSLPSNKDKEEVKEVIEGFLKPSIQYNAETNKNDTIAGFRTVKNVEAFVIANSDLPYDSLYYAKKDLPLEFQEELFNLEPNKVFGPYILGDYYYLTRLVDKKPGASVDAAHILITYEGAQMANTTRTKEAAKAKAEEILAKVQADSSSFATLAALESEDTGSKAKGGKYEGISKGTMVKGFEDFIFNNPTGKMGIAETEYGFHVIQVLDKKEGVKLANIARKIEVSDATADEVFSKATSLEQAAATGDFIAKAKEMNLDTQTKVTLHPFQDQLPGIGQQRAIGTWAFNKNTKEGDIKRFDNADGHIIAKVTTTNNTGLASVSEARLAVEPILMNEKKAKIIRAKMTGATLEEVSKSSNASIASTTDVTIKAPLIPMSGYEPQVVGTAFATEVNTNSKLIDGARGVYMIKTTSVTNAPDINVNSYKSRIEYTDRSQVQGRTMNVLKDRAKIEDNRIAVYQ